MSNLERVKCEVQKYDYIRFSLCDFNGKSVGQVIPTRNVASYLENGLNVYEGLHVSFLDRRPPTSCEIVRSDKNSGNMVLLPDLGTLRPLPWATINNLKVAEITCVSYWRVGSERKPLDACPRYVLRQQLEKLAHVNLDILSGVEVEYYAFKAEQMAPIGGRSAYLSNRVLNQNAKTLFTFDQMLLESGIDIERFHAEDTEGMFEAVMKPSFGIETADATFHLKQGLLEIGDLNDINVTFMSFSRDNINGTGCHFNFSLISKQTGTNAFYDESTSDNLSALAKQWIAGLLKHMKSLTALQCPTVNCYRRLHKMWTPGEIFWELDDREACIRVKNDGPTGTYIEMRLPSGKSNPYIVMASTIAAGIDGVANKMKCPAAGIKFGKLPGSLEEAVKHLEQDLELRESLGEEFVTWFLACKQWDFNKFKDVENDTHMKSIEREIYF